MNKRINELIKRATRITPPGPDLWSMPGEVFDKEKFAELIIDETISVIHRTATLNDCEFMGGMFADSVKEHFES